MILILRIEEKLMMLFMDFFNNNPILEASYGVYFFHNIRAAKLGTIYFRDID
jgi:hypothetical protein